MIIDTQTSKDTACKKIQALDGVYELEVTSYKGKRTAQQNKYYQVVTREIMEKMVEHNARFSHEAWKGYFRQIFLGSKSGVVLGCDVNLLKESSGLNVKEFSEFLEKITAWAAVEYGITLESNKGILDA